MSSVDVSVIVCTLNRSSLLKKCLNSLENQEVGQFSFETIVVDNGSTDDTKAVVESFQTRIENLSYVLEPQKGLGRARNSGFRASKGRLIAYIDDDAQASTEWCATICRAFQLLHDQGNEGVASLGGPVEPDFEIEKPSWLTPEISGSYGILDLGDESRMFPGERHPIGANCAFSRQILTGFLWGEGGGTQLGVAHIFCEDVEMHHRLRKAGYEFLYVPNMKVRHFVSAQRLNIPWLLRYRYTTGQVQAHLLTSFRHKMCRAITMLIALPVLWALYTLGPEGSRLKFHCKARLCAGYLAGIAGLIGLESVPYLAKT